MTLLYNYKEIDSLKERNKKHFLFFLLIEVILLAAITILFIFLNRSNYIYMSILAGLLMLVFLTSSFYYVIAIYVKNINDIKFLEHLSSYESKVNHIYSFSVSEEIINKYHRSFYVINYDTKNKMKEGYIELNKLPLIKDGKIEVIEMRDRIMTGFNNEK